MPNLQEPDWKSLRIGDVREFWEQHEAWENRVDLARKAGRIGDMLVLADEAPVAAFRAEAWIKAGEALRKAERFDFALEQLERGLEIDPRQSARSARKGHLPAAARVGGAAGHSLDRAREHYRNVLELYPDDPETWALLGRVDKDAWTAAWRRPASTPEKMREEAAYEDALLRAAIDSYAKAYRAQPGPLLLRHQRADADAPATAISPPTRAMIGGSTIMAGAVRFAAECEPDERQPTGPGRRSAIWRCWSARRTRSRLPTKKRSRRTKGTGSRSTPAAPTAAAQGLGFRPETVEAGIATFDRALERLEKPEDRWQPRQVLLFSGHMIDAPDRPAPRFPADKEPDRGGEDRRKRSSNSAPVRTTSRSAQAAAGGDLLFLEACQQRGVQCPDSAARSESRNSSSSRSCRRQAASMARALSSR